MVIDVLQEYIQLSSGELLYAFILSASIVLSGYFYNEFRRVSREAEALAASLEEANMDRTSLAANNRLEAEDNLYDPEIFKSVENPNNTILQQELESYLRREEERAEKATQNFVELSADFVDFLKVKSGKIQLKETPFTLNGMLDDLAKSLRSQMARTQVELIFNIDTKVPPKLLGDKRHIRLLLFNLLSNIIHNRSESQITLHATSVKEEKGLRLLFRVQGCTIGDSVDDLDLLFVPFSDSTLDVSMQIELYIARELSKMMQGNIKLDSDERGKSEFKIELLVEESNPEDNRFYRLPSRSMMGHKILIVNENKALAKLIKNMYEYFKNEVTLVPSSELISTPEMISKYHTVVIDKGALSLSLVEKIRAIKRAHKVKVVALLGAKDSMEYQIPHGAVDRLLIKPITIQSVFNTIVALEESQEDAGINDTVVESTKRELKAESNKKTFEDFYSRRILVIENEHVNEKILLTLLRRSGVNLSLAQSSEESLWMLEKMRVFDLILLSTEIDKKTSLTLSQKIRRLGRYKGTPVIVMSNNKIEDNSSGVDQYMSKPVRAGELYTLFNHYLSQENTLSERSKQFRPKAAFINTVSLAARDGFEMASFDEGLYIDILREFIALYSDSAKMMNNILVKDDLEELKQACLDIKGAAADIGALRLASITARIHAAISNGKVKDLMVLMNQYQPELERVKGEIEAYLK